MRASRLHRLTAALAGLALVATACGGDDDGNGAAGDIDVPDGPDIVVSSFNFPESEILGEVYAQAMEAAGYPVERALNLGARELLYPEGLLSGDVDLLPEYLGSALVVWFEQDPPEDVDAGVTALTEAFEPDGVSVLTPAPAENANVFVVTGSFADDNDLSSVADLANLDSVTFAGPPECEDRDTCYRGLTDGYGLDNVEFESVQEGAARLAGVESGEYDVILLFSTDAPLAGEELRVLEDTDGIIPPENITPVLRTEIIDTYGQDLTNLLDEVTATLTTETLQQMNADASEGLSPAEIATAFLEDNGLI